MVVEVPAPLSKPQGRYRFQGGEKSSDGAQTVACQVYGSPAEDVAPAFVASRTLPALRLWRGIESGVR